MIYLKIILASILKKLAAKTDDRKVRSMENQDAAYDHGVDDCDNGLDPREPKNKYYMRGYDMAMKSIHDI
ncbi:MAG: hypothetical protein ACRD4G_20290 [Bryobacteraceae bacterium]